METKVNKLTEDDFEEKIKDEILDKYQWIFTYAGFGEYALDFSYVDAEAIEAMAKALIKLYPEAKEESKSEKIV